MGFIDAFVYVHHQYRQGQENPGNFDDCMKGRIRFYSCLRPCISNDMSIKTHAGYPGKKFPFPEAQSQISVSRQRSFHNTCRLVEKGNEVVLAGDDEESDIMNKATKVKIQVKNKEGAFVIEAHFVKRVFAEQA